jgi:hypothetical protein
MYGIQPAAGQSRVPVKPVDWGHCGSQGCVSAWANTRTSDGPLGNEVRDTEQVNAMLKAVHKCLSDVVLDPTNKVGLKARIRKRLQEPSL